MMTELSFLIDLLLNDELPRPIKELVAKRIKEVEETFAAKPPQPTHAIRSTLPQAPSTLANLAKHPEPMAVPIEQIAQTPAAAQALASREAAINASIEGKVNKETGRPRKF